MTDEHSGLSYSDAGVDIGAANAAVSGIKELVHRTFNENVLEGIGSFGAMYETDFKGMAAPVLVSSMDGVGTKLKLAFMTGKHDTVGIDLVSHCVNDILVQGARPLFFLDYLAAGKLNPKVVIEVVRGLSAGCRYAGCALIGGETAEMPGMYSQEEYDLAGTIVGVVDRDSIVDGTRITAGDAIIGLPSSGLHTNGYSLARKIVFEVAGLGLDDPYPGAGETVAETLMKPHLSYAKLMQLVMKVVEVKGMAHITGGGITDNLPRILPKTIGAEIDLGSWQAPPVFRFLQEKGRVSSPEMLRTFNMGQGFLFVVGADAAEKALETITLIGQPCMTVGHTIQGKAEVRYKGEIQYA